MMRLQAEMGLAFLFISHDMPSSSASATAQW